MTTAELEATHERLDALRRTGAISAEAHARAIEAAARSPSAPTWRRFLTLAATSLGAVLVLSAVIYFFAYNWSALGPYARLTLIGLGLVLAASLAVATGPDRLAGQLAYAAGAVLVGVVLAVIGQAYPTDAESWTLFAGWALLAVPWVIGARWAPTWLLEIVLVNVTAVRWIGGHVGWDPETEGALWAAAALSLLNGVALAVWEWLGSRRDWMQSTVVKRVLAFGLLAPPALLLAFKIFDTDSGSAPRGAAQVVTEWLPLLALGAILVVAATVLLRRYRSKDPFMPTLAGAALGTLAVAGVMRALVFETEASVAGLLAAGVVVIGMAGVGVWLLGRLIPADQIQPPDVSLASVDLMARPSLGEVLRETAVEHATSPEEGQVASVAGQDVSRDSIPTAVAGEATSAWYVRFVVTLSAWLAATLAFAAYVSAFDLEDTGAIGVGLLAWGLSMLALRRAKSALSEGALARTFAEQSALAGVLLAHPLIFFGVEELLDQSLGYGFEHRAFLGLAVLSVAWFVAAPDSLHRYLASVGTVVWIGAAAWTAESQLALELTLIIAAAAGGATAIATGQLARTRLWDGSRALAYGLITGSGLLIGLDAGHSLMREHEPTGWWVSIALGLLTAGLAWRIAQRLDLNRQARIALAAVPVVIGALTPGGPGVAFALGTLLLAFHVRERLLMGLGIVFTALFLWAFYYSLDLTLLEKSALLAASGVVLLALGGWFRLKPGSVRGQDASDRLPA